MDPGIVHQMPYTVAPAPDIDVGLSLGSARQARLPAVATAASSLYVCLYVNLKAHAVLRCGNGRCPAHPDLSSALLKREQPSLPILAHAVSMAGESLQPAASPFVGVNERPPAIHRNEVAGNLW